MRRLAVVVLGVLALGGGVVGCAESKKLEKSLDKLERSTTNNRALNREVATIPLGSSIDSVKSKLGRPDNYQVSNTAGLGKTQYLYYGQWQMSFTNGTLDSKNKY
jgi:hypothetical protein